MLGDADIVEATSLASLSCLPPRRVSDTIELGVPNGKLAKGMLRRGTCTTHVHFLACIHHQVIKSIRGELPPVLQKFCSCHELQYIL